jgi:hypothetical protein
VVSSSLVLQEQLRGVRRVNAEYAFDISLPHPAWRCIAVAYLCDDGQYRVLGSVSRRDADS